MINKYKSKYKINKIFYSRLAVYVVLSIILLYAIIVGLVSFCYVSGINFENLPTDICNTQSEEYNSFFCFFQSSRDTNFFSFIYYVPLIWTIFCSLSLIILNVFYIANKFYFSRLVREFSYGAVIYKIEDGVIKYLLLKMNYGHTSLCKGHQEGSETPIETALREIKEETNLDVDLNVDFKTTISYSPQEQTIKDVTFFLASLKDCEQDPIDKHDEEVQSFERCTYEEAIFKITYDTDRDVIKKSNKYLKKHKFVK